MKKSILVVRVGSLDGGLLELRQDQASMLT
jgi:hypothetical protein